METFSYPKCVVDPETYESMFDGDGDDDDGGALLLLSLVTVTCCVAVED